MYSPFLRVFVRRQSSKIEGGSKSGSWIAWKMSNGAHVHSIIFIWQPNYLKVILRFFFRQNTQMNNFQDTHVLNNHCETRGHLFIISTFRMNFQRSPLILRFRPKRSLCHCHWHKLCPRYSNGVSGWLYHNQREFRLISTRRININSAYDQRWKRLGQ